jgi:hypothetical protein
MRIIEDSARERMVFYYPSHIRRITRPFMKFFQGYIYLRCLRYRVDEVGPDALRMTMLDFPYADKTDVPITERWVRRQAPILMNPTTVKLRVS